MKVTDVQITPMAPDVCSSRIPIRYTFAQQTYNGYMDTGEYLIYSTPKKTDCNMADNIPVWWNNRYQLYRRNGSMTDLQKITIDYN